jgi:GntP family gluconate:H+ symporter
VDFEVLLLIVLAAIILLLLLNTWAKLNPLVGLMITAIGAGLTAGIPLISTSPETPGVIDSIEMGIGNTLGLLAVVIALGTMLGKMLAESGGL